ncbi:hypothetical protein [Zobellella sp. DQSA1]|uniref:hypothetical protein n=1 Tax=Zobellella sp. DQSA1 TaxID=3342386 RepID=UPI0035C1A200
MKIRHSALVLTATLLAAPALVSAANTAAEGQPGSGWQKGQMKEDCGPRAGMKEGRHGKHQGGRMMDPARFEQRLSERLEKLESPELKAQFIASHRAKLASMEQQMLLHKMMAESKAQAIGDADLKAATLEKIAADSRLKQQRLKLMQETLGKLQG